MLNRAARGGARDGDSPGGQVRPSQYSDWEAESGPGERRVAAQGWPLLSLLGPWALGGLVRRPPRLSGSRVTAPR